MGRSRLHRRLGRGLSLDIGELLEEDMETPPLEATETLAPVYVPRRKVRSPILAPVLELEGLDPWTEIQGPALALDEPSESNGNGVLLAMGFDDPSQLVLEPAAPAALDFRAAVEERAEPVAGLSHAVEAVAPEPSSLAMVATADDPPALEAQPMEPEPDAAQPDQRERDAAVAEAKPAGADDAAATDIAPLPPPAPPDPAEIMYGEARAAAEAGHRDEAKRLYRDLLGLHPAHVRARNNLALLLDAEGNHQTALAELDRALETEPDNSTLLVNRGALLGAMGRFAAAEHDLKKVLRVEPSHPGALFNLGVVMTKKGLWGEAVPHLRRAVELDPENGGAHYWLGEALNHVDDLYGALAAYQRAAELQPNNPRALYGLGIIFDRLARPDDAAQMYRRSREVGRR